FDREFERHPNWINKKIYYDEGISGTSLKKREDFNRMIEAAKAGKYQLIVTKDVSRFSRNVENAMSIIVDLQRRGVYIIFLNDQINTQRSEDRDRLTAALKHAESESLRLSNKVKWGQLVSMKEGVVFGRKDMFGYNIVKDEETGIQRFVIIPGEADIIRRVFQMYANGMGTFKIAKQLEREGVPTKRYRNGWSNTVILRMLRNEKYVGDLCTGKTYTPDPLDHSKKYNRGESAMVVIRDHHPDEAIIDRELWDKVQKLLQENTTSDEAKAKHSNRYWCSGKVVCGECKERFVSRKKLLKNGSQYKAWVCWAAQQEGSIKELTLDNGETKAVGCNSHAVNDRVLRQGMYDIITDFIQPNLSSIQQQLAAIYAKRATAEDTDIKSKIAELTAKVDGRKQAKVNLAIKNASGMIDDATYEAACKTIDTEIAELVQEISKLSAFDNDSVEAITAYNSSIEQLNLIMDLRDEEINEAIYRRILDRIEVYNSNILKYYFSFLSKPIIMQYKTKGRGNNFRVEFTLLEE
ncbi:MAG: recombinase family protein, partial [Clostridia bacterium]|nr:recombinase family protein [Clostridia bacterium]